MSDRERYPLCKVCQTRHSLREPHALAGVRKRGNAHATKAGKAGKKRSPWSKWKGDGSPVRPKEKR